MISLFKFFIFRTSDEEERTRRRIFSSPTSCSASCFSFFSRTLQEVISPERRLIPGETLSIFRFVFISQSETLQKLKEQQEAEKSKTPLVLLDPKSQFQPKDAEKFSASIANGTKSSETATTFGKFEKEVSEKEDQKNEEKKDEEDKSENGEEKPAETVKMENYRF